MSPGCTGASNSISCHPRLATALALISSTLMPSTIARVRPLLTRGLPNSVCEA
ncbi:Uncharacterised protein [Bordetella pertussis]|nr:Uncharacterised protein [Bordetella pertussis]CPL58760.1 Uncharacterised protein [Bordetella pertussis]